MNLRKSSMDLVKEAKDAISSISVSAAIELLNNEDVVFVDLRDPRELAREGTIPGSTHSPRGMLEFWIDPHSPYHKPIFAEEKTFVLFCAGGWRSALAAKTMIEMGFDQTSVVEIEGGFTAWKSAGAPVVEPKLRI